MRSLDNLKNLYFTITRLLVGKPGKGLTYGLRFNTEMVKLSLTSCFLFFLFVAVFGRTAKRFFLRTLTHSLISKLVTEIGLISLDTLSEVTVKTVL